MFETQHPQLSLNDRPVRLHTSHFGRELQALGQGAFGAVSLTQLTSSRRLLLPTQAAVKTIRFDASEANVLLPSQRRALVQFLLESRMLMAMKHPNLVSTIGLQSKYLPIQLAMEVCAHGNLKAFVRGHTDASSYTCDHLQGAYTDMVCQVASAVAVRLAVWSMPSSADLQSCCSTCTSTCASIGTWQHASEYSMHA